MKRINNLFLMLISIMWFMPIYPQEPLAEWKEFLKKEDATKMTAWAKCILLTNFKENACEKPEIIFPEFYGKLGIFITLVTSDAKVRGCFGSFYHKTDDIELLFKEYLRGASREDPRYTPVSASEIDRLKIWITITAKPSLLKNNDPLDLKTTGLYLLNENLSGIVFVPNEIKDQKILKSIIQKKQIKEVYTFKAIVIQEN